MPEDVSMYNKELSQLINDARELLGMLRNQHEINAEQIKHYKSMLDEQSKIQDKRMSLVENSMRVFRNLAIMLFTVVVIPFVVGGFTLKSDVATMKRQVETFDYATKAEVLMSFGVIIDQQTGALESMGMDMDEADRVNDKMKEGISQAFGYKSRSIKK